jgi:dipeptidyl aminopeptidase/acylaminoacyl peptidase
VDKKIADPKRIAIMGGSYGGYAAVMGLCLNPDRFTCAVDISGPTNLVTFLQSIPQSSQSLLETWATRVGDFRTEEGRSFLMAHSPMSCVEEITRPLLLASGAMDERVKPSDYQQFVEAVQAKGGHVTWVTYPDEGHGLSRPANRRSFFAVAESFLGEHLGGRVQPVGSDFEGSSIQIPAGGDELAAAK